MTKNKRSLSCYHAAQSCLQRERPSSTDKPLAASLQSYLSSHHGESIADLLYDRKDVRHNLVSLIRKPKVWLHLVSIWFCHWYGIEPLMWNKWVDGIFTLVVEETKSCQLRSRFYMFIIWIVWFIFISHHLILFRLLRSWPPDSSTFSDWSVGFHLSVTFLDINCRWQTHPSIKVRNMHCVNATTIQAAGLVKSW